MWRSQRVLGNVKVTKKGQKKQKRQKELSWFQSFIALKRDTELHSTGVCHD